MTERLGYLKLCGTNRNVVAAVPIAARVVFLATAGLRRAACAAGTWSVIEVAPGRDVRCLTADPVQPMTVFAGTTRGA
jgi:hypothetical protein